jgi:G:T-mismatch repair DNA endonuclease (very short patch repair protein)
MADMFTPEVRSKIMGSIRSTSKLEQIVRKALWERGLRYRKNVKGMFGTPDISIKKNRSSFSWTPAFGTTARSIASCRKPMLIIGSGNSTET